MDNKDKNNESFFTSVFNQGQEVLNEGVTINVAFDYVSTAYLALALFVGILFASIASNVISQQIIKPS